ncbi:hypothetical protein AXG93_960s1030 [Marchantia polymorpha subsp. ruderalis]|uniref:Reverse transcriptase domain-containing protein n=1 Tax=Marchantia polymorpha subsp. ruderalis TaxID=1480154 RepID=A0A176VF72_MARPO|nr:hypothetical protein AXG93_960s1030 [Marchantia polymorpha subsp. ruderalis]
MYGFPSTWSLRKIVHIHKSRRKYLVTNYHTIMVGSVFAKLFGKLVESKLSTWTESHRKRARFQAGFRPTYNTIDHILALRVLWEKSKGNGKALFCAFIDFKKAFDTVCGGASSAFGKRFLVEGSSAKRLRRKQERASSAQTPAQELSLKTYEVWDGGASSKESDIVVRLRLRRSAFGASAFDVRFLLWRKVRYSPSAEHLRWRHAPSAEVRTYGESAFDGRRNDTDEGEMQ